MKEPDAPMTLRAQLDPPASGRVARRAFSLIELLVSIGIIAVLMGILIPTLPRVRDAARRTACSKNLQQVGLGLLQHLHDHNDRFPTARYMPPPFLSGDADPAFNGAIADYLEADSASYRCPGDSQVWEREWEDDAHVTRQCNMSYTFVTVLSGRTYEETFFHRRLELPATEAPVLHDFDGGTFDLQDGSQITVGFFHSKRAALFVDGHAGLID
jgi:prepilin-type N-terminal cleavage/methylation domain-containing protein